jgi:hypothetical protein
MPRDDEISGALPTRCQCGREDCRLLVSVDPPDQDAVADQTCRVVSPAHLNGPGPLLSLTSDYAVVGSDLIRPARTAWRAAGRRSMR